MFYKSIQCLVIMALFLTALWVGMGREIERREKDFVCDGDYCAGSYQEIDAIRAAEDISYQVGKSHAHDLLNLQ